MTAVSVVVTVLVSEVVGSVVIFNFEGEDL